MIKLERMYESISLKDIQNAKYAASFMKDRAEINIDGRTYAKIGKNKWEYIPMNPHAYGGEIYTDKQIYDEIRDSDNYRMY